MAFRNRYEAGRLLAERLSRYRGTDALVMGIPNGGVAVAYEIAEELDADLDIILARKLGAPYNKECAIGALAEDGREILDDRSIRDLGVSADYLQRAREEVLRELDRDGRLFRGGTRRQPAAGRDVILVDDGVATGMTLMAAAAVMKSETPRRLVLAVPVAAGDIWESIASHFDEAICLEVAHLFFSVGQYYDNFDNLAGDAVLDLLRRHKMHRKDDTAER